MLSFQNIVLDANNMICFKEEPWQDFDYSYFLNSFIFNFFHFYFYRNIVIKWMKCYDYNSNTSVTRLKT